MRSTGPAVAAILLAASGAAFAQTGADAPIVYSARYYGDTAAPPATHPATASGHTSTTFARTVARTREDRSYFHLFRIDADGTHRRQLTTASADDSEPHWSPDGRAILFVRETPGDMVNQYCIYTITPDGMGAKKVYTAPPHLSFYEPQWSADGHGIRITLEDATVLEIATATGAIHPAPVLKPAAALPIVRTDNDGATLIRRGATPPMPPLRLRYDATLKASIHARQVDPDSFETYGYAPGHGPLLLRYSVGGSTEGHWYIYYAVNEKTKTVAPFAEGNCLCWSPDGTRFVTTAGRNLAPGGGQDAADGMVWVSPLLLGAVHGGSATTHSIVNGAVYVTDCDWRPTTR